VVWTAATQFADGTLDVDRDPPTVNIDGLIWEHGLSSAQAPELAATLIEAADEVDGWAAPLEDAQPAAVAATWAPGGIWKKCRA
jgi:hypothetical protein